MVASYPIVEKYWDKRIIAHNADALEKLENIIQDVEGLFESKDVHWLQNSRSQALIRHRLTTGEDLVIKKYKIRNLDKRIRRAVTPSRAYRSWLGARRLEQIGLPTPKPWLVMENRFGPFRGMAYLFCEYCDGRSMIESYVTGTNSTRENMEAAIARMFVRLREHRISHRDTKDSNFLWSGDKLWILDLDSIRYHRTALSAVQGSRRDVNLFVKSWHRHPDVQRRLRDVIEQALRT